jgi:hypothetical protein
MWKPDPWTPLRELARWHVTTQIGARRNALLACTALAQRRREHDDVEKFLSRVNAPGAALPSSRQTATAALTGGPAGGNCGSHIPFNLPVFGGEFR